MRTDPTDTGGLFVGRRPGTRPVRYRRLPERGSEGRRRIDALLAAGILALMAAINLAFWGPIPLAGLWLGSRIQYWTGNAAGGILVAFLAILGALLLGLVALKQLDAVWVLVRRAAGHDQRRGVIGRMFAATCVVGAVCFGIWFVLFSGAELAPIGVRL